jgi:hypothetical protein
MPTALRRSKSLPALLAAFAALVVIATIAAVVIGNLMSAHRSQAGSDGTDDMANNVGRASRVAVVTPLSTGVTSSTSLMPSTSDAEDSSPPASAAASALASDGSGAAAMSSSAPDATSTAAAPVDAKGADATSPHHAHLHAALHRPAPQPDSMRMAGTLRADIARYNAERRSGNRAAVLRAASVPNVHSLWDEVPGPMSDVYRN